MEDEITKSRRILAEAGREIMWVTNEIHETLDLVIEDALKTKNLVDPAAACYWVKVIRAKLCKINSINMEKLFGAPKMFLDCRVDGLEAGVKNKETKQC